MEVILILAVIVSIFLGIAKFNALVESKAKIESNRLFEARKKELELEIEQKKEASKKELALLKAELEKREVYLTNLRASFEGGYIKGRRWLAEFISEAGKTLDDQISNSLRWKKRPAYKAAEEISKAKAEKRNALKQLKFLEFQIKSYEEYFPFLEEFKDTILDEQIDFSVENSDAVVDDIDRVGLFLSPEEYKNLSTVERNQLALDRYLARPQTKWGIGRFYERYLGYLYESEGWDVNYTGAIKRFEDMGRDLICRRNGVTHIVQAKCWSTEKTIHEKHVFQLYGTALYYEIENSLLPGMVVPIFITTTLLSEVAKEAAKRLAVVVIQTPLDKYYPIIKCNINQGEKIYHLPIDQQYDRVKIQGNEEFYVQSVKEAEQRGFRRAKRYFGEQKI